MFLTQRTSGQKLSWKHGGPHSCPGVAGPPGACAGCPLVAQGCRLRWVPHLPRAHRGFWGGRAGVASTPQKNSLILIYFCHSKFSYLSQWAILLLLITELPFKVIWFYFIQFTYSSLFIHSFTGPVVWFLDISSFISASVVLHAIIFLFWIISLGCSSESEITAVSW